MLVELAEEPGLWLPPQPGYDVVIGDGFAFVTHGRSAWVHRIQLVDTEVDRAVGEVRDLLRAAGLAEVTWWIGSRSKPGDLAARLRALGLGDDDPPVLRTLVIDHEPAGEQALEIRRVETLEDYLLARELDSAGFDVPESERQERLDFARSVWPSVAADGSEVVFLAYLDGEAVGFGRVVLTARGGLLLGGATLPHARGRGVYTSLVHARWRETVERGAPHLVVSAGPMSAPILEGLGFRFLGEVRRLSDRL